MPELPEVETVRRTLCPLVLGRRIDRVEVHRADVIEGSTSPSALGKGDGFVRIDRRGKQLALITTGGRAAGVHLGMTGRLMVERADRPIVAHTHVTWHLGPDRLVFVDPRPIGAIVTCADGNELDDKLWSKLGPDALTISAGDLFDRVAGSTRAIKAALLDQSVLAGVGNIYADEALFDSGIDPRARCSGLSRAAYQTLAASIRTILSRAVRAGGSTLRDYVDARGKPGKFATEHRVYGRAGRPCVRCGLVLKGGKVGGRTTAWCDGCQKRKA